MRATFDQLTADVQEQVRARFLGDDDSHRQHVYNLNGCGALLSRRHAPPGTCGRCRLWREIEVPARGRCRLWREIEVPARGRCLGPGGITKSFERCDKFEEVTGGQ